MQVVDTYPENLDKCEKKYHQNMLYRKLMIQLQERHRVARR